MLDEHYSAIIFRNIDVCFQSINWLLLFIFPSYGKLESC